MATILIAFNQETVCAHGAGEMAGKVQQAVAGHVLPVDAPPRENFPGQGDIGFIFILGGHTRGYSRAIGRIRRGLEDALPGTQTSSHLTQSQKVFQDVPQEDRPFRLVRVSLKPKGRRP